MASVVVDRSATLTSSDGDCKQAERFEQIFGSL
jgi:hypothetical protein